MDVPITEMAISDYEQVLALWQRTEGVGLNESDTRESIAAYLARNPGLSLVARHEGQVVAAVLCGHDGRRGYLHHLSVAKPLRQNGIGSRLVEACLANLAALGIQKCNIFLFSNNEPGKRFWKNNGWVEREWKVLSKECRTTGAGRAAQR